MASYDLDSAVPTLTTGEMIGGGGDDAYVDGWALSVCPRPCHAAQRQSRGCFSPWSPFSSSCRNKTAMTCSCCRPCTGWRRCTSRRSVAVATANAAPGHGFPRLAAPARIAFLALLILLATHLRVPRQLAAELLKPMGAAMYRHATQESIDALLRRQRSKYSTPVSVSPDLDESEA